jgi:hypothetical protein
MMEHLPALAADAIKASLRMVYEADIYVGVFAYRYGYVPDGHEISITEMEYDRAVELKKPRLIFFIHEDHLITGKDAETGPAATKLQALKDRIGKAHVAAFFKSAADLRAHVVEALTTFAKELDAAEYGDAHASTVAVNVPEGKLRLTVHRAYFLATGTECFFVNATNILWKGTLRSHTCGSQPILKFM